jgi:hypothetical protein
MSETSYETQVVNVAGGFHGQFRFAGTDWQPILDSEGLPIVFETWGGASQAANVVARRDLERATSA